MSKKSILVLNCVCGCTAECSKDQGVWVVSCTSEECDAAEYSVKSKEKSITNWNNYISKHATSINHTPGFKNEVFVGMARFVRNISIKWHTEHGEPMTEDDMDELVGMFSNFLEECNNE